MRLLWLSLAAPALTTDCSTAPCGARALLDAGDARFPLSASFDLTADLAARCSGSSPAGSRGRDRRERNPELRARHERAENRSGLEERLELQMRRYRSEPVFGLLENKLLVKRALAALRIPHVAPIYAALAHDRHPARWAKAPRYSRRALERAVGGWPGWPSRALVLKAATDGQGKSVHVLDRARLQRLFAEAEPRPAARLAKLPPLWVREHAKKHADAAANASASLALVARTAEALLAQPADWGQQFEHRGVLLEARRAAPPRREKTRVKRRVRLRTCLLRGDLLPPLPSPPLLSPLPRRRGTTTSASSTRASAAARGAARASRGRSGAASSSSSSRSRSASRTPRSASASAAPTTASARAGCCAASRPRAAARRSCARTRATARAPSARRACSTRRTRSRGSTRGATRSRASSARTGCGST